MSLVRVAVKLQRFEVAAVVIAAVLAALLSAYVAGRMNALGVSRECFQQWFHGEVDPTGGSLCFSAISPFLRLRDGPAAQLLSAISALPIAFGGILGVAAVARELETGTAAFTWAAATSRRRWLVSRTAPIVAVLLLLTLVLSASGSLLGAARQPWAPSLTGFAGAPVAPPVMIIGALAAYWVAVLAGLVTARTLPAVLTAGAILVLLWAGPSMVISQWAYGEAANHVHSEPFNEFDDPGGTAFGTMSRLRGGALVHDEEAPGLAPPGADPTVWMSQNATQVFVGVPGEGAGAWVAMVATALGLALALSTIATSLLIERRRV